MRTDCGARVVVADINASAAEETVRQVSERGGAAVACVADVTLEEDARRMVEAALHKHGRLDFAANVAGVDQPPMRLEHVPLETFERDRAVNSRGVFLSMKHEIPAMVASGGGSIVNITSGAGIGGFAFYSAYCAAKHAAVGLTRAAALEYADRGVRINSVAPGAIATPMLLANPPEITEAIRKIIPAQRFGTAENIAAATVWLCSEASGYVSGQVLPVDGAFSTSALGVVSPYPDVADR